MAKKTSDENSSEKIEQGERDSKEVNDNLKQSEQLMSELRTLAYCTSKAVEEGYKENFDAKPEGLISRETGKQFKPEQMRVVNFYRFEGITDPGDMAVLYVLEADDGTKGTLVDAYGTYSDYDVAQVIKRIDEIAKKGAGKSSE